MTFSLKFMLYLLISFLALSLLSCTEKKQTVEPTKKEESKRPRDPYTVAWGDLTNHEKIFYCLYYAKNKLPKNIDLEEDYVVIVYPIYEENDLEYEIPIMQMALGCRKSGLISTASGHQEISKILNGIDSSSTIRSYTKCTVPFMYGVAEAEVEKVYSLFPKELIWNDDAEKNFDDYMICTCKFKNVHYPFSKKASN